MGTIKQIDDAILKATHHRDQLHEITRGFIELHGYEPGSDEGDVLMGVTLDGEDYETALNSVIRMNKRRAK